MCTSLKQFLIPFEQIAIDNVQVSAFFHMINCSCHVDQNIVDGSLLNSLTPQNIEALVPCISHYMLFFFTICHKLSSIVLHISIRPFVQKRELMNRAGEIDPHS